MMERLLDAIIQKRARFTILDLTSVDIMDTSTTDCHAIMTVLHRNDGSALPIVTAP